MLNIKGLQYKTVWTEFNEVERVAQEVGFKPTAIKPDSTPWYTLPAIYDPNTQVAISDSFEIAQYLDTTYPAVCIIPEGTLGLQDAFQSAFEQIALANCPPVMFKMLHSNLFPDAAAHVRWIREEQFGATLEKLAEGTEAQWEAYKEAYGKVGAWYDKNGKGFIAGDAITYADVVVAIWLLWIKSLAGEHSKEWKDVVGWHGGRWATFLEEFNRYDV